MLNFEITGLKYDSNGRWATKAMFLIISISYLYGGYSSIYGVSNILGILSNLGL